MLLHETTNQSGSEHRFETMIRTAFQELVDPSVAKVEHSKAGAGLADFDRSCGMLRAT